MHESSSTSALPREKREGTHNGPAIEGVRVREDDIESVKAIRAVAFLFRGMAVLMLFLMAVQFISAVTGTLPLSRGRLKDRSRWGAGSPGAASAPAGAPAPVATNQAQIDSAKLDRVYLAVFLSMASPDYLIQK